MSHSASTRNADSVFFSSTDAYVRKNTKAGFLTSLGLNYATQAEAEAGAASDKVMSPLRVAQAIDALSSGGALTNGYVNSNSLTHGDLYDILSPYVPNVDDRIPAIGGVVNHPDSTLVQSGIIVHEIWRNTATSIAVRGSAVSRGFGSGTYWWTGSLAETLNSGATSPIRIYYLQW
jgi:hypothetical protein